MFFGHNGGVDTRLSGLKPRLRRHLSVPKPSGNTKQYKRRIGLRVGRRAGDLLPFAARMALSQRRPASGALTNAEVQRLEA